jgi:hypothetical protein
MPFSHDEFLDLFAVYNGRLWPPIVISWVASLGILGWWVLGARRDVRPVMAMLAVHWAWSGIAYHWWHFRAINPAATIFATGFVAQAAIFAWLAWRVRELAPASAGARRVLGMILLLYGLAYPGVGLALGLSFPRMPLFAVPCPTVLVTAGVLVMLPGLPRWVSVIPLLWALIGSSAAFSLGIRADLALVVAAGVLGVNLVAPSVFGRQRAAGLG